MAIAIIDDLKFTFAKVVTFELFSQFRLAPTNKDDLDVAFSEIFFGLGINRARGRLRPLLRSSWMRTVDLIHPRAFVGHTSWPLMYLP
jgi:hypothetical protein